MRLESWRPSHLAAVVRFWNRAFSSRRHFAPLTARLFRERVVRHPEFDPRGFILAREGRRIAGVIHVGRRPNGHGYVALFCVDADQRKKGIGTRLWHRGLASIRGAPIVSVLNAWENPFYGSPSGNGLLWGTPWGIGVDWGDSASLKFLARKGHAPRAKAVQLAFDLSAGRTGTKPRARRRRLPGTAASFVRLGDARRGLFGLSVPWGSLNLGKPSGRAEARRLLAAVLEEVRSTGGKSCEVLSSPDLEPELYAIYLHAGFVPVASWAVF